MKNHILRRHFGVAFAALLISPLLITADTVISVTGDPGLTLSFTPTQAYATSWSQSNTYGNVSISIFADAINALPASAIAYLTNTIGPGTTAANEIAQTLFTISSQSCSATKEAS